MAKAKTFKTKNGYQKAIFEYEKRLLEYKVKFGKDSLEYKMRSKRLRRKLTTWRCALKRIEKRERRIEQIDEQIYEFIGVRVKSTAGSCNRLVWKAKRIFYKYGIENGIGGNILAEYVGLKDKTIPSIIRLQYQRSFPTNKENRELYNRFLNFTKRKNENDNN